jgi:hypothetical protein
MTLTVACPHCRKNLNVAGADSESIAQCCHCGGQFKVPALPSHIPFCRSCNRSVNPNVVSRTHVRGGVMLPTDAGFVYGSNSTSELVKVCPFCGEQVFSDREIAARNAASESDFTTTFVLIIVCLVLGVIVLFIVR